jgi:hypothetical protein
MMRTANEMNSDPAADDAQDKAKKRLNVAREEAERRCEFHPMDQFIIKPMF